MYFEIISFSHLKIAYAHSSTLKAVSTKFFLINIVMFYISEDINVRGVDILLSQPAYKPSKPSAFY